MATVRVSSSRADARDGIVVEAVPATGPEQVPSSPKEARIAAVRGTTVKLAIPLDKSRADASADEEDDRVAPKPRRHRRDSLERREALLKGKEGSRRRQRWENDRLLHNPWAQPPLPSDWQIHPTHPVRIVPYYLAPLWDKNASARREAERERHLKSQAATEGTDVARVPKELRARLKKARAAKGLLYDLEEEVRRFVATWERRSEAAIDDGESDEDEDEIVFVGRNGHMRDAPPSPKALRPDQEMVVLENILAEKLVFGSPVNDEGAGFARWLVHAIASYYGLHTWSVTRGNPAHRDAYVGIDREVSQRGPLSEGRLPVPLWGMV